jgi:hypothetical protein
MAALPRSTRLYTNVAGVFNNRVFPGPGVCNDGQMGGLNIKPQKNEREN